MTEFKEINDAFNMLFDITNDSNDVYNKETARLKAKFALGWNFLPYKQWDSFLRSKQLSFGKHTKGNPKELHNRQVIYGIVLKPLIQTETLQEDSQGRKYVDIKVDNIGRKYVDIPLTRIYLSYTEDKVLQIVSIPNVLDSLSSTKKRKKEVSNSITEHAE